MNITAVLVRSATPDSIEELPLADAAERFSAGLADPSRFVDVAGIRVEGIETLRDGRFSLKRLDDFGGQLETPVPRALVVSDEIGGTERFAL